MKGIDVSGIADKCLYDHFSIEVCIADFNNKWYESLIKSLLLDIKQEDSIMNYFTKYDILWQIAYHIQNGCTSILQSAEGKSFILICVKISKR